MPCTGLVPVFAITMPASAEPCSSACRASMVYFPVRSASYCPSSRRRLSRASASEMTPARTESIPSTACDTASSAVLTVTDCGRFAIYFPSKKASLGKRDGAEMLVLVCFSSLVMMAYGVTSLPVPAVVGICTIGRTSSPMACEKMLPSTCCRAAMAIAFAASIGEPPPIATMNSAPRSRASRAPSSTHCTVGLGGTASYRSYACPFILKAYSISSSAPLRAELFPVTTSARLPNEANSPQFFLRQSCPLTMRTGI